MMKTKTVNLPKMPIGQHIKIQMAAWLMGKSTKWMNKKIEEGALDGYLLDGDIVVSVDSMKDYLRECCITGKPRNADAAEAESENDEGEDLK